MLNTREFPEKAGRIYPPLAIIEYGQVIPNINLIQKKNDESILEKFYRINLF
jgi:hypothetical protein